MAPHHRSSGVPKIKYTHTYNVIKRKMNRLCKVRGMRLAHRGNRFKWDKKVQEEIVHNKQYQSRAVAYWYSSSYSLIGLCNMQYENLYSPINMVALYMSYQC